MSLNTGHRETEEGCGKTGNCWEILAITALCIILVTPFIYNWRAGSSASTPILTDEAEFAGTASCKECHPDAYQKWQGSDHDKAMAEATEKSVLGNFNDVTFVDPYSKKNSRFFKEDTTFMVETEGPDGKPGIFNITHTFGVYPLQQYLIPFPGGRLQCLTIAWDIEKKQWYRLPPYDIAGHTDWLHWTKGAQTWNGMCAECHSTKLQKGFDIESESYKTTWFEINVGCEACHGPAAKHVSWAKRPALGRPQIENYGFLQPEDFLSSEKQIIACAPCHSRRYQLGDNDHTETELLDLMVPSLLTADLYHADGQIKEEVYVYGSFTQSKMYQKGVRCNDCHDPHSLKPHKEKNDLCLQCHRASEYDSTTHHFHEKMVKGKPNEGALCVKCHMPGQYYMGIDYRPDHSLRIPRPDISKKLGTPNGCSAKDCHGDKSLEWNIEHYRKWYGEDLKPHYGEILAAGRARKPGADIDLIALVEDGLLPAIVRATALNLLENYPGEKRESTARMALQSDESLIRQTAFRLLEQASEQDKLKLIAPKLYDPVKGVRIEAALALAQLPPEKIREDDRLQFATNLSAYREAMEYNADFAAQRYNLGNLERKTGNPEKAVEYYLAAIAIDSQFFPAKVNLAMEYNSAGKNKQALILLKEVVAAQPELFEVAYSLGLLLSEMKNYEEAAGYLGQAADGMPGYARVRYNQGLALLKLKRWEEGGTALRKAVLQDPYVNEYFVTLVNLYLNFRMNDHAQKLAEEVLRIAPDHVSAKELIEAMSRKKVK